MGGQRPGWAPGGRLTSATCREEPHSAAHGTEGRPAMLWGGQLPPTRQLRASPLTGPQTVDLIPVFSSTGTRLMAPSMCWVNTSQSRSRPKGKVV